MVSVTHSVAAQSDFEQFLTTLTAGLSDQDTRHVQAAVQYVWEAYADRLLSTGERTWAHALGMALIVAGLRLDAASRMAALLFAIPGIDDQGLTNIEKNFGRPTAHLVSGISRLNRLRTPARIMNDVSPPADLSPVEIKAQVEVWRKMLLAMVEDVRVVLLRLASRTQTMRYYATRPDDARLQVAQETMDLYAPLANRLGVWELKWELEDLSFRFLQPETYKRIARMLDEKRGEREQFITDATARVQAELQNAGVATARLYGRPKHIYSIWNKMQRKGVSFDEVYDVRALRIIVDDIKSCYSALSVVHNLWAPIPEEFDDYIANPKGNQYRSLHTAVRCADNRSLEIQIRTNEMHHHAELGVAAHWRYKEGDASSEDSYDEKIAWLRQLLTWKDDVTDNADWVRQYKRAALNETLYVMTPQGRVVDLPDGATAVDFAYRVHTSLGHRCRGAKIDGQLLPLNTRLQTGQCVEIITAKTGGPSRDWLNPTLGYLQSRAAKMKVRAWFANLALEETLAEGKALLSKELQRAGQSGVAFDDLAQQLNFAKAEDLFIAAARGELSLRQFQSLLHTQDAAPEKPEIPTSKPAHSGGAGNQGILIVGVDKLLTQLARCCKPAPPDEIVGFTTRGKGISIHRHDCSNFLHLSKSHPDRLIETTWGQETTGVFATDIAVDAHDRQGLLRDISDVFAREKINVIGVNTQSRQAKAQMRFTIEIASLPQLRRTLSLVHEVEGVVTARRA